ncbi:YetF domain-containing protein, partial [Lactiplantibacillus plantarum]|uniref:YetF domain-containing protein n=1 Tax=Lactiplantibacillus plantarum TaxID=1590 RepID=UPI003851ED1B
RPTLLLEDGRLLAEGMRQRRVTEDEIRQAVRSTGSGDLADVAAVVLESDGSLSVISASQAGNRSALEGVRRAS